MTDDPAPSAPARLGEQVGFMAASVAFYGFLAFVPLMTTVILVYGLVVSPRTVAHQVQTIAERLPESAARLVAAQLRNIVAGSTGGKIIGAISAFAFALVGALSGGQAIRTALALLSGGDPDSRGFIATKLAALGTTLRLALAVIVTLIVVGAFGYVGHLFRSDSTVFAVIINIGLWVALFFVIRTTFKLLYREAGIRTVAGGRTHRGATYATLIWFAGTLAFSLYVANFGNYNATYGSLAGVVVLMLWFYISAYAFLWGARHDARKAG